MAAAIRAAIDALDLAHAATPSGRLTVSIGVACRTPDASVASETLVEAADAALYLAKGEGRDRVVMADRPIVAAGRGRTAGGVTGRSAATFARIASGQTRG